MGGNLNKDEPEEKKQPSAAFGGQGKGGAGSINFGAGKPTFMRSNKGIVNKQEFPELGDVGAKESDKPVFKKDMGY